MREIHLFESRGKWRLWIEGKLLRDAGFAVGDCYNLVLEERSISIFRVPFGQRRVTSRRDQPIVDVASNELYCVTRSTVFEVDTATDGVIVLLSNNTVTR